METIRCKNCGKMLFKFNQGVICIEEMCDRCLAKNMIKINGGVVEIEILN